MPIYEYQCRKCHQVTEEIQGVSDPPLRKCPACGGRLEKMMSPGAFVLKGTGWYATDYADKGNGKGSAGKEAPANSARACPASAEASAGKSASGGNVPPACAGCPKAH